MKRCSEAQLRAFKKYRETHKQIIRENMKAYYEANKEVLKQKRRERYAKQKAESSLNVCDSTISN